MKFKKIRNYKTNTIHYFDERISVPKCLLPLCGAYKQPNYVRESPPTVMADNKAVVTCGRCLNMYGDQRIKG